MIEERWFVRSLERGLAVILALTRPGPGMTLAEVGRDTGLTRASARRFLLTLQDLGYVRSQDRRFSLTPRVLELGYSYLAALTLPELARPHLRALSAELDESSSLTVLDGTEVVYVAREAAKRIMTAVITIGTRLPAHATAVGRVLLAGLTQTDVDTFFERAVLRQLTPHTLTSEDALRGEIERVREQGWAFVDQELEEGLRAIAVPIRGSDATVLAAANVSTHTRHGSPEMIEQELLPRLLEAAARIERDLVTFPRSRTNG